MSPLFSSTPFPSISSACVTVPSLVASNSYVPGFETLTVLGLRENSFSEIWIVWTTAPPFDPLEPPPPQAASIRAAGRRTRRRRIVESYGAERRSDSPVPCSSKRARSSAGQSSGLIIRWSQVRVLAGPSLADTHRRAGSRPCAYAVRPAGARRERVRAARAGARGRDGSPRAPGSPLELHAEPCERMCVAIGDPPGDATASGGRGHALSREIPLEANAADRLHRLLRVPIGRAHAVDAVLAEARSPAGRVARGEQEGSSCRRCCRRRAGIRQRLPSGRRRHRRTSLASTASFYRSSRRRVRSRGPRPAAHPRTPPASR